MISRQFLLFVIVGGIAAAANFFSRIAMDQFIAYVPSIVVAYCIGMLTAFLLNRAFVFNRANNPVSQQLKWFVLVNLLAVLQTIVISLLLARILLPATGVTFYPETIAHAVGIIIPVFTSYYGHKRLSFRERAAKE